VEGKAGALIYDNRFETKNEYHLSMQEWKIAAKFLKPTPLEKIKKGKFPSRQNEKIFKSFEEKKIVFVESGKALWLPVKKKNRNLSAHDFIDSAFI
jgi:hypothetical protein